MKVIFLSKGEKRMKLLIDDANIEAIKRLWDVMPIDGVTTNPTILSKYGDNPWDTLKAIREVIGEDADLHVQAVPLDTEGMIEDAKKIVEVLGSKTIVKLPCVPAGFKAMKACKKLGIRTTGTVVYTPLQAYLAAQAGAEFVAPYINRIDNMGYDGIRVCKEIQDILDCNNIETCGILAASFKNSQQVLELAKYGVEAATCAPDVIDQFVASPAIQAAADTFVKDFTKKFGKGSMKELI